MLLLQKSLMQNVTNLSGCPPHMHNSKGVFSWVFFRSLGLRRRSINLFKLLITPILLSINQALFYDLTREVMTSSPHSSKHSANQEHVLQQTDATPAGKDHMIRKC